MAKSNVIKLAGRDAIADPLTELREGGNLISAMFSGKKILNGPPVDQTNAD